jgi:hypothetical protein
MSTKNKTKIQIKMSETSCWGTPPRNEGQIIITSYGLAADGSTILIIVKEEDRSDQTTLYRAYELRDDDAEFEPWNYEPRLGKYVGEVERIEDE